MNGKKWKLIKRQKISEAQAERRLEACKKLLAKIEAERKEGREFVEYLICSDEKYSELEHGFNHHNDGYLCFGKPEFHRRLVCKTGFPEKVMVLSAASPRYGLMTVSLWLETNGKRITQNKDNYVVAPEMLVEMIREDCS